MKLALALFTLCLPALAYSAPDPRAAAALGGADSTAGSKDSGGADAAKQPAHKSRKKAPLPPDDSSTADATQDRIHTGDAHPMMSARHEKTAH